MSERKRRTWTKFELWLTRDAVDDIPTAHALLEWTMANPGEWITFPRLCDLSGRTDGLAKSDLALMTRRIDGLIPRGRGEWPGEVEEDDQGHMRYRATETVAANW